MLLADAGGLTGRAAAALEKHLQACGACRDHRAALGRLAALAAANLPAGEPGAGAREAVRRAARAAANAPARVTAFPRALRPALAYAALLALVAGGWFMLARERAPADRTAQLGTLLSMLESVEYREAEAPSVDGADEQLRALARRLLAVEGLADDETADWETPTADAELPPTTIRSRSIPVAAAETRV